MDKRILIGSIVLSVLLLGIFGFTLINPFADDIGGRNGSGPALNLSEDPSEIAYNSVAHLRHMDYTYNHSITSNVSDFRVSVRVENSDEEVRTNNFRGREGDTYINSGGAWRKGGGEWSRYYAVSGYDKSLNPGSNWNVHEGSWRVVTENETTLVLGLDGAHGINTVFNRDLGTTDNGSARFYIGKKEGRLRKVDLNYFVSGEGNGSSGTVREIYVFYDYGVTEVEDPRGFLEQIMEYFIEV